MFPNFGYQLWILLFPESSTHSEASPATQGQSSLCPQKASLKADFFLHCWLCNLGCLAYDVALSSIPQMCMCTCRSEPLFLSFFFWSSSPHLFLESFLCVHVKERSMLCLLLAFSTLFLRQNPSLNLELIDGLYTLSREPQGSSCLHLPVGVYRCALSCSVFIPRDLNSGSYACSFFSIGTLFPPFFFFWRGEVQDSFLCLTALVVL